MSKKSSNFAAANDASPLFGCVHYESQRGEYIKSPKRRGFARARVIYKNKEIYTEKQLKRQTKE